jgi:hypothetical protein
MLLLRNEQTFAACDDDTRMERNDRGRVTRRQSLISLGIPAKGFAPMNLPKNPG